MSTSLKASPQVVDEREWRTAYQELLAKEKALTHARDELAAHRRRLIWSFLDLTPFGRQELWEDSPSGRPQSAPYQWWRRHDEYEAPND